MRKKLLGGLVHELPADLANALADTREIIGLWQSLTPIARNEFICWVEDAKQEKTRVRRIERTVEELLEGQKRPCCWAGCIHRIDKQPSSWQQAVLIDKKPRTRPSRIKTG
jgi:Bacteriocin-protection, YdeI or OmpD-Associated